MRPHPGSCRRELGLEYLFRIFIFFLFCPPPRGLWLHLHLFLRAIVTLLLPLSAGRGGIAPAPLRGPWWHCFCPPPRIVVTSAPRAIVTLLLPLSAGRGGIASARRPAGRGYIASAPLRRPWWHCFCPPPRGPSPVGGRFGTLWLAHAADEVPGALDVFIEYLRRVCRSEREGPGLGGF